VEPFSGGEKARLALALVAYGKPNLLLLDEPTNHLDLEMRQALAMALQEYAGAVVMVSHDRHLLATVTDRFLLVSGGRVQDFDGDLDDYARWLARSDTAASAQPVAKKTAAPAEVPKAAPRPDSQQRRREGAEQRKSLAPLRSRLARVEKRMQELATESAKLDEQLADPALYEAAGRARQMELSAQRARAAQETEAVEAEWLELSGELERAGADS
jgi:ATP-binding cassette subfamily F protein 3